MLFIYFAVLRSVRINRCACENLQCTAKYAQNTISHNDRNFTFHFKSANETEVSSDTNFNILDVIILTESIQNGIKDGK